MRELPAQGLFMVCERVAQGLCFLVCELVARLGGGCVNTHACELLAGSLCLCGSGAVFVTRSLSSTPKYPWLTRSSCPVCGRK